MNATCGQESPFATSSLQEAVTAIPMTATRGERARFVASPANTTLPPDAMTGFSFAH